MRQILNRWFPALWLMAAALASDEPLLPDEMVLGSPEPNPFNTSVTVSVFLPNARPLTVDVYNILGRKVATLYDGPAPAGEKLLSWEPRGRASGMYFICARTPSATRTVRALLIK